MVWKPNSGGLLLFLLYFFSLSIYFSFVIILLFSFISEINASCIKKIVQMMRCREAMVPDNTPRKENYT